MSTQGVRAGKGYVEIGLNDDPLYSGLRRMQARMRSVGESMQTAGAAMFSGGAAGLAAFVPAVMLAADAAEGFNRFQAVMGSEAAKTDEALAKLAERVGRYKTELRDTASSFQGLLVGLGMSKDEAAKLSTSLTELSIDFASFNNLSDADASERFLAGLSGSGEVFDRFGINIKEGMLKLKLAEMGIKGTATELQKAQARIAIIQESMARQGATKDATTTANSFANQLKAIGAEAKQAAEDVGKTLIPELTKYAPQLRESLSAGAKWLAQNPQLIVQVAKLTAAVTAGGLAFLAVGKALTTASTAIDLTAKGAKLLATNWQAFAAGLAIAAIIKVAYEIYQANTHIREFNDQLERGRRLTEQMDKLNADRLSRSDPQSIEATRRALENADNNAAGLRNQVEGARKQVEELSTTFNTLTGNKILEGEREALRDLERRADAATQRAQELRMRLKELQDTQNAQKEAERKAAAQATADERQRIRQVEENARRHSEMLRGLEAQSEFSVNPRRGQVNPLAIQDRIREQEDQFRRVQESITGTFSGAALGNQSAQVALKKQVDDAVVQTAKNTEATVTAVGNLARALQFG